MHMTWKAPGPNAGANEELLEEVDAPRSALAKAEDNHKALNEALQKVLAGMSANGRWQLGSSRYRSRDTRRPSTLRPRQLRPSKENLKPLRPSVQQKKTLRPDKQQQQQQQQQQQVGRPCRAAHPSRHRHNPPSSDGAARGDCGVNEDRGSPMPQAGRLVECIAAKSPARMP